MGGNKKTAFIGPARPRRFNKQTVKKSISQITGDVNISAVKRQLKGLPKRKRQSEPIALAYEETNLPDRNKIAYDLRTCSKVLTFADLGLGYELVSAYFCRRRLCPCCSWRRARKIFENVYSVITDEEFTGKEFIFITLTVRNVPGDKLSAAIDHLWQGFRKLTKNSYSPFSKSFAGTFRAVEITYNPDRENYHPHLHIMAAVEPEYFRKTNPNYISHVRLRELWRDACGLDYLPQVNIKKVKGNEDSVAEAVKYTVKPGALRNPAVVETLHTALYRRRLIAYGGLFKTVRTRLNLPDEDDLPEQDCAKWQAEEAMQNPYIRKIVLEWNLGTYKISAFPQSPEEKSMSGFALDLMSALGGQGGA